LPKSADGAQWQPAKVKQESIQVKPFSPVLQGDDLSHVDSMQVIEFKRLSLVCLERKLLFLLVQEIANVLRREA
jgi:hypothetical protein